MTQLDLIMEYFKNNPNREIKHAEIVDWLTTEWEKRTGTKFRDPDRGIRSLAKSGKLIKVAKGIYKYDPTMEYHRELEDFTQKQKEEILKKEIDINVLYVGKEAKWSGVTYRPYKSQRFGWKGDYRKWSNIVCQT